MTATVKKHPEPQWAYTGIVNERGYIIGRADKGIAGYTPMLNLGTFDSYNEAQAKADELNARRGLSKIEAAKIVLTTLGRQP